MTQPPDIPPASGSHLLPIELETCDGQPVVIDRGPALIVVYRGHW